ncbi:MAG: flavodoxin family protein [Pyramidobacter sp.]|jgi:multimeric flavodoxin WrbA
MSADIVILNGSPRRKGNTSALVRAFAEGAESSGHHAVEFFLNDMNIRGCRGCFGGHSDRECPCVQKDDMVKIYPAVREAKVIVLASPLYYWTVSGQLKTVIDRLFALEEGGKNLLRGNDKSGALLMAAEGSGFEDSVNYFDHLMTHLRWKNIGHVLAGGNLAMGDIEGKPELKQAYELGRSIS